MTLLPLRPTRPPPRRVVVPTLVAWVALAVGAPMAPGCARPTPIERALSFVRQHREGDAVIVLRARLAAQPDDDESRRLLVRILGITGDVAGAREEVRILASRRPLGDPMPLIELGHALELAHKFEEALAAYDEAATVAPASPAGPREGGLRCARWGEIEEAEVRLEEAVRRGARDGITFHALGLVRVHLGKLDAAEQAYREGLSVDPSSPSPLLGLATVAVMRGDAAAALAAYDALCTKQPAYAPAELGRAWALARLGRFAEARRAIDRAEALGAPSKNVMRQRAALPKDEQLAP